MEDTRSYIHRKPKKNQSRLYGIRTHDLCDTGAVLYQLSNETNWEQVTLRVCNFPIEDKDMKVNI